MDDSIFIVAPPGVAVSSSMKSRAGPKHYIRCPPLLGCLDSQVTFVDRLGIIPAALHSDSSCPAKAGHLVYTGAAVQFDDSVVTGSSAFADDDE
jgi:hypothetical protein